MLGDQKVFNHFISTLISGVPTGQDLKGKICDSHKKWAKVLLYCCSLFYDLFLITSGGYFCSVHRKCYSSHFPNIIFPYVWLFIYFSSEIIVLSSNRSTVGSTMNLVQGLKPMRRCPVLCSAMRWSSLYVWRLVSL